MVAKYHRQYHYEPIQNAEGNQSGEKSQEECCKGAEESRQRRQDAAERHQQKINLWARSETRAVQDRLIKSPPESGGVAAPFNKRSRSLERRGRGGLFKDAKPPYESPRSAPIEEGALRDYL